MKYFLLIMAWAFMQNLGAQNRSQYHFAQTYLGFQTGILHAPASSLGSNSLVSNRLSIGGLHFWRYADFYVSFPLNTTSINGADWHYSEGVITGARILPFGLYRKRLNPYLGVQWMVTQAQHGRPIWLRSKVGLDLGLNAMIAGSWSVEVGAHWVPNNQARYYNAAIEPQTLDLPAWGVEISLKKYLDFTASLADSSSQVFLQKTEKSMAQKGHLNAWGIGVGPTANIGFTQMGLAQEYFWMPDYNGISISYDLGISHFWHKYNSSARVSFRPSNKEVVGPDRTWRFEEKRLSAESFAYLFNYKGFLPFIGFGGGATHLRFSSTHQNDPAVQEWIPTYHLAFGWDIRPSKVEWFVLRTNLRYTPALQGRNTDTALNGGELEFNFIQMVVYPERLQYYF